MLDGGIFFAGENLLYPIDGVLAAQTSNRFKLQSFTSDNQCGSSTILHWLILHCQTDISKQLVQPVLGITWSIKRCFASLILTHPDPARIKTWELTLTKPVILILDLLLSESAIR